MSITKVLLTPLTHIDVALKTFTDNGVAPVVVTDLYIFIWAIHVVG